MKIYTVTPHFISHFQTLFKSLGEVELLPASRGSRSEVQADLIIFTGGEDIGPSNYGQENTHSHYTSPERDAKEFETFRQIRNGRISTKRVLGVCRGLQLLNVAFGGSLYQDIGVSRGKYPQAFHPLRYYGEFPITEELTMVNSYHHQAIANIGDSAPYNVIAIDPATENYEIIMWEEKYLALQFHPEFMPDSAGMKRFVPMIDAWINGMSISRRSPLWKLENFKAEPKKTIKEKILKERPETKKSGISSEIPKFFVGAWDTTPESFGTTSDFYSTLHIEEGEDNG